MYDVLIKNGRVIDPSQNMDDSLDIGITGNKISVVAQDIAPQQSQQVIDASNKIVTAGIIDLHCHVAGGLQTLGVDPDAAGVTQGVTTVVDGGSTGESIFVGFPRYV
ncbi:MAG: hypothetical protein PHQ86_09555, partial [Dehalococcoidales bacterium]|nr:hypothetical protein [Dehalococcoidales bacterium]